MGAFQFAREVVRFEKKKIVLPLIMCAVVISAAYGVGWMQSTNTDRKILDAVNDISIKNIGYTLQQRHFNTTEYQKAEEFWEGRKNAIKRKKNLLESNSLSVHMLPYRVVQRTPFFVLEPKPDAASFRGDLISPSSPRGFKRVYISEEIPKYILIGYYETEKLEEIEEKLEKEEMNISEFNSEMKKLIEIDSVQDGFYDYFEHIEDEEKRNKLQSFHESYSQGQFKELGWVGFVPLLGATFVLYYVLNGLIVVTLRLIYRYLAGQKRLPATRTD